MDAALEAMLSTGSGSSTSATPNSSTIVKQIEKKDQTTDGQTAVTSSQADGLKALPEDTLVGPIVASPLSVEDAPTMLVGENDATRSSATGFQTNVPVFATADVAGESAKDLAAAARSSQ